MSAPSAPSTSRLDGKVALVTGSGRGMGRQNALELASRGASLVINYSRSSEAANAVVKEIETLGSRAIAIAADMSKPAEIAMLFEKAIDHYGKLDIVVSNSGVESFGHISEVTAEEFDRVFAINTKGQLLVAQQAYKHLEEGGRLVRIYLTAWFSSRCMSRMKFSGSRKKTSTLDFAYKLLFSASRSTADSEIRTGHAEQYQCFREGRAES